MQRQVEEVEMEIVMPDDPGFAEGIADGSIISGADLSMEWAGWGKFVFPARADFAGWRVLWGRADSIPHPADREQARYAVASKYGFVLQELFKKWGV